MRGEVTERRWPDLEEATRNIERGVFDDSSLDTMPLGEKEERLPSVLPAKRARGRRAGVLSPAKPSPDRAAG